MDLVSMSNGLSDVEKNQKHYKYTSSLIFDNELQNAEY